METVEEKRWEYEVVEVGQKGTPFTVEVTQDLISKYAQRVRNPNPAYQEDDDQLVAMPTMVIAAAPLRRFDVAEANGFVALELVQDSPRQTPFAKCGGAVAQPYAGRRHHNQRVQRHRTNTNAGAVSS